MLAPSAAIEFNVRASVHILGGHRCNFVGEAVVES